MDLNGLRMGGKDVPEPAAKPASGEESRVPKLTVETIDNHVYFYAVVDTDRCLALVRTLRELDSKLRNESSSRSLPAGHPPTPIWLHIQSGGGGIHSGLSVADQLPLIQTPIFSVVEGYCASAATLISMSATRRFIMPRAFMLIHQVSSFAWGKYEEFKDEVHILDMIMDSLVDFYAAKSKLKRREIKERLKRDSWFSAEEAIAAGLADEILRGA